MTIVPSDGNGVSTPAYDSVFLHALGETRTDHTAMKKAVLGALLLALAVIWAPLPTSGTPVIAVPEQTRDLPPNITVKPPPEQPNQAVELIQEKGKLLPVPDPTPMEPEIMLEPMEVYEPDVIYSDNPFTFDPGAGPPERNSGPMELTAAGLEPPVITRRVLPNYPMRGLKARMQGYVILEAVLRGDGSIDSIRVLRQLGKGRFNFEDEAIKSVEEWEFIPGKLNGKTVDVRMTLKIDFQLGR
ncbi:TonB family protein [Sulfidibacter corallicola]|uniref:TonB family protein n=1 Tax=Sulfidibacter corallicola TaxID=2818388 RepID=A0A8A4TXA5_SULCO|nr:energy transducer TonB [Sulfidibacter corallicola]QTD53602.1 TonB family protein [Sulfidibacter corallicola]